MTVILGYGERRNSYENKDVGVLVRLREPEPSGTYARSP